MKKYLYTFFTLIIALFVGKAFAASQTNADNQQRDSSYEQSNNLDNASDSQSTALPTDNDQEESIPAGSKVVEDVD